VHEQPVGNTSRAQSDRRACRPGLRILIYGASGSIGTAAVQLARYFDADVTAVCNTKNIETVRSPGAGQVIDYTQEDFTKKAKSTTSFSTPSASTRPAVQSSLRPGGFYLATEGWQNLVLALWTSRIGDKGVVFPIPPRYPKKDVLFLRQLIEAGRYRAVIDRCYPLAQVADATRYVETEQKTGNVVLTVSGDCGSCAAAQCHPKSRGLGWVQGHPRSCGGRSRMPSWPAMASNGTGLPGNGREGGHGRRGGGPQIGGRSLCARVRVVVVPGHCGGGQLAVARLHGQGGDRRDLGYLQRRSALDFRLFLGHILVAEVGQRGRARG
jgi:hypothetical protein